MLVLASYLVALVSGAALSYYLFLRMRGSLRYWLRTADQPSLQVLGQTLPIDSSAAAIQSAMSVLNAAVRDQDQRCSYTYRRWDRSANELFVGLVWSAAEPPTDLPPDCELRDYPAESVVRCSGSHRIDERPMNAVLQDWLGSHDLHIAQQHFSRLSGQSFELYQWPLESPREHGALAHIHERVFQLRDNLVLPIVGMLFTLGLLGTGQPILFAVGTVSIVFLSGACKFIFIHQRTDEADEVHLQNY